ncbi:MAG: hypothetical protein A3D65_00320 [Candidatus Lloydbacteria bacterium RIFCSPHIGHO2_02_FULL_50_13]|uniref:Uncharacterized protein n=1 Tax=Candidatus Lloydbacteria bacterium RIFCSPHIGHO2_02_FULL_50_13 TaxID=1798661 RepID=A0A1G2D118_9BACT|nr:MAG: hypothetical protein A3D65_00320 [Candidatus Lloydbacteria bacterium RIFCSPHIGHO2_02_FULL_50_13]
MAKERRISFGAYDAAHLYELAAGRFFVSKNKGMCPVCFGLKKRLEKLIGKSEVRRIRRQIRKHPYI